MQIKNTNRRQFNYTIGTGLLAPFIGKMADAQVELKQRTSYDRPDQGFILVSYRYLINMGVSMNFVRQGKAFVAQRDGTLRFFSGNRIDTNKIFGMPNSSTFGLGGLLDFKVGPESINQPGNDNIVVYFTLSKAIDRGLELMLMKGIVDGKESKITNMQPIYQTNLQSLTFTNYGGVFTFDKNGDIFLALGDRGVAANAQNPNVPTGKILHIKRDGKPAGNYGYALPEIYAMGFNNPTNIQYVDNKLFVLDLYPNGGDEINLVTAGGNYGWPLVSSQPSAEFALLNPQKAKEITSIKTIEPFVKWENPKFITSFLHIGQHNGFVKFKDWFLIGTRKTKQLSMVRVEKGAVAEERILLDNVIGDIQYITDAPDGLVYIFTSGDTSSFFRLEPAI